MRGGGRGKAVAEVYEERRGDDVYRNVGESVLAALGRNTGGAGGHGGGGHGAGGQGGGNFRGGLGSNQMNWKARRAAGFGGKGKNSDLKELTIVQMNNLVEKNRGLKADLVEARKKISELSGVRRDVAAMSEEKEMVENELRDLKRRLGSREYMVGVAKNKDDILSSMEGDTRDVLKQFVEMKFTDDESIKFALGVVQHTSPGAKLAFITTLLAIESPSIRASCIVNLGKLVENDRMKTKFVREVLNANETTPDRVQAFELPEAPSKLRPVGSSVQHDPSAATLNVTEYYSERNSGARVVTVKNTYLLAFTTEESFVTKHRALLDQHGRMVVASCVGCGSVFVDGVSDIAPCIVVGPEFHGRVGEKSWVCLEHWQHSVSMVVEDEVDMDTAAIEQESEQFYEASPVLPSRTSRYRLKRKLAFPCEEDFTVDGVKSVVLDDEEPGGGAASGAAKSAKKSATAKPAAKPAANPAAKPAAKPAVKPAATGAAGVREASKPVVVKTAASAARTPASTPRALASPARAPASSDKSDAKAADKAGSRDMKEVDTDDDDFQ